MKNVIFFVLLIFLAGCNAKTDIQQAKKVVSSGDTITVPSESNLIAKLITKEVQAQAYKGEISTFGSVQAIPNNYAEIAAPFAGRITKSFVRLGQHVEIDEPIFEISSPAFCDAVKSYYQAKQEMQLAHKNLNRQQDLIKNGVGTQKDLEEADVNYKLYQREYENAMASIKVYKVNPEQMDLGQALMVRSPIAGHIVSNNIVIGQYLKEDASEVAVVAELSKVWIIAEVKENDIHLIPESERIEITSTALAEQSIEGKIYYISDILDEETRSVQVYIECDNTDRYLKPGMYVSVKFIDQAKDKIIISASSIFQKEEGSFVYIDEGNHKYTQRIVDITTDASSRLILKSGLKIGEKIVDAGGRFLLEFN